MVRRRCRAVTASECPSIAHTIDPSAVFHIRAVCGRTREAMTCQREAPRRELNVNHNKRSKAGLRVVGNCRARKQGKPCLVASAGDEPLVVGAPRQKSQRACREKQAMQS